MGEVQQIGQDLQFVRQAVARRERSQRGPVGIYWIWAAYVLVGYSMIDLAPRFAGPFLAIGGFVGGGLSWWLGRRHGDRVGEHDVGDPWRPTLHFGGGIVLAVLGTFALSVVVPELRGTKGSQVLVVMIGVVYFLAGVHFDRNFLWLGPVVMAGGVGVGLVSHYGWTMLGAVIAVGLVVPTLVPARPVDPPAAGAGQAREAA